MSLNAKEIPFCLCRMIHVSTETSFTFMRRHPRISGVLILFIIVYSFLSYIYHFLVYLSPFLVCTAIFLRIFWSSEHGHLEFIKWDKKKEEQKKFEKQQVTEIPSCGSDNRLLQRKYSFGNATSRRRIFTDKKVNAQDNFVVEEINKVLPTIPSNDSENKDAETSEIEDRSSDCTEKLQDPEPPISRLMRISVSDQQKRVLEGSGVSQKGEEPQQQQLQEKEGKGEEPQQQHKEQQESHEKEGEGEEPQQQQQQESQEEEDEVEEEEEEEEEETQEDLKKAVQWTKDDQKNLMDLGISEIERNRRLESLIARRRARQHLKQQIEKGLIDIRSACPSQIAPLLISRTTKNVLDSPKGIDGLDIPGSAPSVLRLSSRNPFDLPYDPSEERPNLTGDSFDQEFTAAAAAANQPKETAAMAMAGMAYCRHESFSFGPSSLPFEESYPYFINGRKISDRFRRLPDKGNHEVLIEKLFSKDGDVVLGVNTGVKAPKPLLTKEERKMREEETAKEADTKNHKTDMKVKEKEKDEEEDEIAEETKPMLDHHHHHKSESNSKDSNSSHDEKSGVLDEPEKPNNVEFLNFPPINTSSTSIPESSVDSFASPTIKNNQNLLFSSRCIFHKPNISIASDLQVEFSEVGSPTALSTIDGESMVFDGDTDKEIGGGTPRGEDFGGALFNLRESSEEDMEDVSINGSSKGIASLLVPPLHHIDEEEEDDDDDDDDDVGMPRNDPSHVEMNHDYNIFCDLGKGKVETEQSQPSSSSNVSSPHLTEPEKTEESQNLSENSRTESTAIDEQNSYRNEDPGPSILHQELMDPVSVSSFPFFSPRSVLPEKTLRVQVVSSPAFDQQIRTRASRLNIEGIPPTSSAREHIHETMPEPLPLRVDPLAQTLSDASSNAEEASCSSTMADDSNTTDNLGKIPIFDDEDGKENHTSRIHRDMEISGKERDAEDEELNKCETSSEDQSTSEEDDKKSRSVVDDEVASSPSEVTEKNIGNSTDTGAEVAIKSAQSVDANLPEPNELNDSSKKEAYCSSTMEEEGDSCDVAEDEIEACVTSNTSLVQSVIVVNIGTSIIPENKEPENLLENADGREKTSAGENDAVICKIEDRSSLDIRQDDGEKSPPSSKKTDLEDKDDKSREAVDKEVTPSGSLKETEEISNLPIKNDEEVSNWEEVIENLNNDTALLNMDRPNDTSEKTSNLDNELKKNENSNNEVPSKPNDSSKEVSYVHNESNRNDTEISNKEEDKQKSKDDTENSNNEDVKETLKNDISPKLDNPNEPD